MHPRAAYNRAWRLANKDRVNARVRQYKQDDPAAVMLKAARHRARKKAVPFDIEAADIVIPSRCPVLGIPLVVGVGARHAGSPSLDRIAPELGYVRGNVEVISYRANQLKNDATVAELSAVLAYTRSRLERQAPPLA